jgi:uncharacterized protein YbjT (DUF2867 family)
LAGHGQIPFHFKKSLVKGGTEMKTYAVTGATGNTGTIIASRLLEAGHKVRAIGRSKERLASLVEKGAEAHVGSMEDAGFLTQAFKGTDAVYAMIPPNLGAENYREYMNQIGEAITSAAESSGVKHVVTLSSLGAHLPEKTGPIAGLTDLEQSLNKLDGAHILHLRPAFFMENLMAGIDIIKNMGVNGSALRADIQMPMIATQDIGQYAAERLSKLDFSGHSTRELLGERDLSMKEATTILGKAIGKEDLDYVQFSYEDTEKALQGIGMSPSGASSIIELDKGLNDGYIKGEEPRTADNTTQTSMEDFSQFFAAAFSG